MRRYLLKFTNTFFQYSGKTFQSLRAHLLPRFIHQIPHIASSHIFINPMKNGKIRMQPHNLFQKTLRRQIFYINHFQSQSILSTIDSTSKSIPNFQQRMAFHMPSCFIITRSQQIHMFIRSLSHH